MAKPGILQQLDNHLADPSHNIKGVDGRYFNLSESGILSATSFKGGGPRNAILSARQKNGLPAHLCGHEFLNMEHEAGQTLGATGAASASANLNTTYECSRPLANQIVPSANSWRTPANTKNGWWQYDFNRPHVLTGMFYTSHTAENSPGVFQIQGWNAADGEWENLYAAERLKRINGASGVSAEYGRTLWFTQNKTAYSRVRVNIESVAGTGTYIDVKAIRFFEASFIRSRAASDVGGQSPTDAASSLEGSQPLATAVGFNGESAPGLSSVIPAQAGIQTSDQSSGPDAPSLNAGKNDIVLAASASEPFEAVISAGDAGDYAARLEKSIVIPGNMLAEMSRNYLYLVPANTDGSCPAYAAALGKTMRLLPEAGAYLISSLRKINYGSEAALKKQCLALLQSRETESRAIANADATIAVGGGGFNHRIRARNITIDADDAPRGAASSYSFITGSSYIAPPADLSAAFMDKAAQAHPGGRDFTVELDFKYEGPERDKEDAYRMLFDAGHNSSQGFALMYRHRRGQINMHINGAWWYAWAFSADENWHSLSLSRRADKIYLHVDGKCLGFYNACPPLKNSYNYWMLGRWIASDANHWRGKLANFRYIIGDCLRQAEDYAVDPVFNLSPIPNKTLWWDAHKGTVRQWQAGVDAEAGIDAGAWADTPLLPIGHVDTGWQEHLHTAEPRGTHRNYELAAVSAITETGRYDGNCTGKGVFNFAEGGSYGWLTPSGAANNTALYQVQIELEQPAAFAELRLVATAQAWNADPCLFSWEGSNDGLEWVLLIDRSLYERDGTVSQGAAHPLGATHCINGMRRVPYDDAAKYKMYRLSLLAKGAIPYHQGTYTACRLQLPLRGAAPEITGITPYVSGDVLTYGPIMLAANTEYVLPAPFGGAEFEIDGHVVERHDHQSKKRKIGQICGWWNTSHAVRGEIVYGDDDTVVVVTGNSGLSLYSGSWYNSQSVAAASPTADATIICRRIR